MPATIRRVDEHPGWKIQEERREQCRQEGKMLMSMTFDALDKLLVHLRHTISLDAEAVYLEKDGSTIVYYNSPHGKLEPGKICACIVYSNDTGEHREVNGHLIRQVGFRPVAGELRTKTDLDLRRMAAQPLHHGEARYRSAR